MIIKYEIEKFAKDIESKIDSLDGKAKENALEKLAVLNRVSIEFMEYEDLLKKVALQNNELKSLYLKQSVQVKDLKQQIDTLVQEIVQLKSNIYG